jgi:hypothetical protein
MSKRNIQAFDLPSSVGNVIAQYVQPSDDTTGATDTAALQASLTAAGVLGFGQTGGIPGNTYYIDAPLVIFSGCTLDMTDCEVILANAGSSNGAMVRNYAAQNAAATASDAVTTSGSNVINTSLGAVAVVGQSVVIAGAGGASGAAATYCGIVSATTSTTITAVDLDGSALNAGPTATPTYPISTANSAGSPPAGTLLTVRVPAGWRVKVTCATMADLTCYAVSC